MDKKEDNPVPSIDYKELVKWLHEAFNEVLSKSPPENKAFIDIMFKKARRNFEQNDVKDDSKKSGKKIGKMSEKMCNCHVGQ
jgi:DNA gyrase/topoisomerase IV subunit B